MSQPYPVRPSAPKPGPPAAAATTEPAAVDPAQIGRDVAEFTAQVDAVRRSAQDRHDAAEGLDLPTSGVVDLSTLDAQAELLERAHDVLTATLEQLDRV